jgi:uncharacterized protein (TIGR02266 family)
MNLKRTIESLFPSEIAAPTLSQPSSETLERLNPSPENPESLRKLETNTPMTSPEVEDSFQEYSSVIPRSEFESLYQEVFGNTEPLELPAEINLRDQRKFSRAPIAAKKVGIRFQNKLHFARQYIENISTGGLYLRTKASFRRGEAVKLEFSIPDPTKPSQKIEFKLQGTICRKDSEGVGLEFTNLDQKTRNQLEEYVQSILSDGLKISSAPKSELVAKIEDRRTLRKAKASHRRGLAIRLFLLVALVALNLGLGFFAYQDLALVDSPSSTKYLFLGSEQIEISEIKTFYKDSSERLWLESQSRLYEITDLKQTLHSLPPHLQHQIQTLKRLSPTKALRQNKNAPMMTQTR